MTNDPTAHLVDAAQAIDAHLTRTADNLGAGYVSISLSWTPPNDERLRTITVSIGTPDEEEEE